MNFPISVSQVLAFLATSTEAISNHAPVSTKDKTVARVQINGVCYKMTLVREDKPEKE